MTITRAVEIRSHAVFPLLTGISSAAKAVDGTAAASRRPPTSPYVIRFIRDSSSLSGNTDEPRMPGTWRECREAPPPRGSHAEAKRMRLGCREPSFARLGCMTVAGPPCGREDHRHARPGVRIRPMVNVRTEVCAGQRSWSTKANPG